MKRTKQWWTALTKEERSELHMLERANSSWLQRMSRTSTECSYCKGPRENDSSWLCSKCMNRRMELIKKTNEITLHNT